MNNNRFSFVLNTNWKHQIKEKENPESIKRTTNKETQRTLFRLQQQNKFSKCGAPTFCIPLESRCGTDVDNTYGVFDETFA